MSDASPRICPPRRQGQDCKKSYDVRVRFCTQYQRSAQATYHGSFRLDRVRVDIRLCTNKGSVDREKGPKHDAKRLFSSILPPNDKVCSRTVQVDPCSEALTVVFTYPAICSLVVSTLYAYDNNHVYQIDALAFFPRTIIGIFLGWYIHFIICKAETQQDRMAPVYAFVLGINNRCRQSVMGRLGLDGVRVDLSRLRTINETISRFRSKKAWYLTTILETPRRRICIRTVQVDPCSKAQNMIITHPAMCSCVSTPYK